jgi:hypothetical protein
MRRTHGENARGGARQRLHHRGGTRRVVGGPGPAAARHPLRPVRAAFGCRRHLGHRQSWDADVRVGALHLLPQDVRVLRLPDAGLLRRLSGPPADPEVHPGLRGGLRPARGDPLQLRGHRRRAGRRRMDGSARRRHPSPVPGGGVRHRHHLDPPRPAAPRHFHRRDPALGELPRPGRVPRQAGADRGPRQLGRRSPATRPRTPTPRS